MILKPGISQNVDEIRINSGDVQVELTPKQKNIMSRALDSFNCSGVNDNEMKEAFYKKWNERENLRKVSLWWDNLPTSFYITQLGVALANAYIHGKVPSVPCLY